MAMPYQRGTAAEARQFFCCPAKDFANFEERLHDESFVVY
jgi:hypothetical protein